MRWYRGKLDIFSGYHLFGGFFLCHLLMFFFGFYGILITFLLGTFYEIVCDGLLSKEIKFFDGNGGSWSDVFCDLAGCVLALFV